MTDQKKTDAPSEVFIRSICAGVTTLVAQGAVHTYSKEKDIYETTKPMVFFQIPPAPHVLHITTENVMRHGFNSVAVLISWMKDQEVVRKGQVLFSRPLRDLRLSPVEEMGFDDILAELEKRSHTRQNPKIDPDAARSALRALRSMCGETVTQKPSERDATAPVSQRMEVDGLFAQFKRKIVSA